MGASLESRVAVDARVGARPHLPPTRTVAQALALGVFTVAVAPLFTLRRTRRMDIPSTLRVME